MLASNTSALSVTEIAAATATPERVVGMHFFNPAPLMPLVEIVRAERSADEAVETAYALGERLGKHPIRCHDTPGFVVNRVLIPLLNDCVRVLDEARVTVEDLDAGMKHGAGWPMGPCELLDLVGLDVHVHASEALYEKLREPRMAPPPRIVAMANAGLHGRKTGRGFYDVLDGSGLGREGYAASGAGISSAGGSAGRTARTGSGASSRRRPSVTASRVAAAAVPSRRAAVFGSTPAPRSAAARASTRSPSASTVRRSPPEIAMRTKFRPSGGRSCP